MAGSAENANNFQDILGRPLSIGDKVLYSEYHDSYYKSDRRATLEYKYVVGADEHCIRLHSDPPFKRTQEDRTWTDEVYEPQKKILLWSGVMTS